jgi:carbamoyltransferase
MKILGISAFYHDSAAAIIIDGEIVAAAQEERFTRKKFDASFPKNAVKFCLTYAGTTLNELDAIVFYDKPFLKFERLLETYYNFSPRGVRSFITSMPVWIKEKIFLRKVITDEFNKIENFDRKKVKLLFPEHHLSHAASTFFPSPFHESAILTIDAVGEWATASICKGEGNSITIVKQLDFPHSLGLLYSAFTYFLGFKVNSGEYKLMGLAPYGIPGSPEVQRYVDVIKKNLVDLKDDGSLFLNQEYFNYAVGLTMVKEDKWEKLFGFSARKGESNLEQHHCNLALAIQEVTEEAVLNLARETKRVTGSDNLCMAGGVSLNCVANGKLDDARIFKNIFITPAAGDAGGALGAASAAYHIYFDQPRLALNGKLDHLSGSFLGPEYSAIEIRNLMRKYNAQADEYESESELTEEVARLIADGAVIGWHQGRMEFGPRALGARSIIADARNSTMQKKLNLKIKYREGFRPFAPIVLAEDVSEYFCQTEPSPYMLLVKPVKKNRQIPYPADFKQHGLLDKLYFLRSDIPAVTHIDYSARLQTVHKETNHKLWNLLNTFKRLTGYSVLVNTSFNVRGEPIVNTPEDAYRCFMRTDMDYLVIGDFIFDKKKQPKWQETKDWRSEFVLD